MSDKTARGLLAAALLALTAACGGQAEAPTAATAPTQSVPVPSVNPEIHAMLPKEIRDRGYLANLVQSPNAPMEYTEASGGPLIGVDIDLVQALGAVLGVEIRTSVVNDFTQLIPSVQTKRTDIVMSAVKDLKERQASVGFVDYFVTGDQFITTAAQAPSFKSVADLCGKTVVAANGTSYFSVIEKLSAENCAGRQPIETLGAVSAAEQLMQVRQGRAVANLTGLEPQAYQMKVEPGVWAPTAGEPMNRALYGVVFAKDDEQLGKAVQAGLNELIKTGVYQKILAKWNLSAAAVDEATINGGK
ncbi:polar amino acid transport system substrate-binding protein [Thermocatellispora tengchongensis]|uniref:Polar amino acid transport system substrate-binding protein n=1 Tax=Thermocatellispora tengchongensis TaxID=1073253 RepID=A0A840P2B9_9ACTN|nr:transporter substrate-binding domain-containing protein [Thermocatellispora tengchongensis]MBB5135424.1 polar amino acid transport system substrate-binding protein [Thermocatellispora tengchongensis]